MDEGKDCEVCGKGNARIFALVDGVKMRVCEKCSKFGKVVEIEKQEVKGKGPLPQEMRIEEEIVEDYADRIKSAREKSGKTRTELAALIGEKESSLRKVEASESPPTDKMALKLQKALGIKLYELVEESSSSKSSGQGKGAGTTFGDMIEVKKNKK